MNGPAPRITICLGSSCHTRGNRRHLAAIRGFLEARGMTEEIALTGQLCANRCTRGPTLTVDGSVYEQVDDAALREILQRHFGGAEPPSPGAGERRAEG